MPWGGGSGSHAVACSASAAGWLWAHLAADPMTRAVPTLTSGCRCIAFPVSLSDMKVLTCILDRLSSARPGPGAAHEHAFRHRFIICSGKGLLRGAQGLGHRSIARQDQEFCECSSALQHGEELAQDEPQRANVMIQQNPDVATGGLNLVPSCSDEQQQQQQIHTMRSSASSRISIQRAALLQRYHSR